MVKENKLIYTLPHPKNDHDVTERDQEYMRKNTSFYASILLFFFESLRKHTSCEHNDKFLPLEYMLEKRLSIAVWNM